VVVTSSVVAVVNLPPPRPDYVFTESDFATVALETANKDKDEGRKSHVGVLYSASKIAAERAVWKFRDEHKPNFAITAINPSVVIGPPVVLASSPNKLNETLRPIFSIFSGAAKTVPPNIAGMFIDVRDVAFMHVWAYENSSKADGERYIACQGVESTQAIADILRHEYQGTEIGKKIVVGNPGEGYAGYNKETGNVDSVYYSPGIMQVSGKKAETEMGVKYISFAKSVLETAEVLKALL